MVMYVGTIHSHLEGSGGMSLQPSEGDSEAF